LRVSDLKWFSERKGIKKPRTEIQIGSIDIVLRNRLWNLLDFYWNLMEGHDWINRRPDLNVLFMRLWHNYYKQPLDTMPKYWDHLYKFIRKYFFECEWNEVYDFIEFIARNYPDEGGSLNQKFMTNCNIVLEQELSAYRFVGDSITELTSKEEISEVEEALETPFKTVSAHLENALKLMSDKKSPDYRNSIKDSISSVEAIYRLLTNDKNATLGTTLDMIEKQGKISLHGALKKAFDSLYGYASSAEGIRHAFSDEKVSVSFEEAKFMLVSCSAFVNYLTSKISKAGIKIA
jgi:hypothetical protein